jgi:hypothetical protein
VLEGELHVESSVEDFVVESDNLFVAKRSRPSRAPIRMKAEGVRRVLAIGATAAYAGESYDAE